MPSGSGQWLSPQLLAFLSGLAAIIGATVAVCLSKIDASTYIALVSSIGGVGVGVGIHAQGVVTGASTNSSGGGQ